ncbi:L-lactate dehydrogenase [Phenylobacterium sp. J367]|uniref:L-lactate dehydrogenase n=1 Tax=Phenylobacterium sp. J367 TaxID=2898435 RepID=UPI00215086F0|nr:L-lactate dehydrogenase [Phenylobacterium sp. J367]MCR5880887.1 L-lactate dehydrogenase [Phenylobacterium sp. J367]
MRAASVSDFRELARRRLPRIFFEYIDGGSYAEETLRRNVADLEAIALRQRVMRDMTELDMGVEVFGQKLSMPVGLAPVGMSGMYAARGEVQAARAAQAAGIPFCLSTVGVCSLEEVTQGAQAPWFQLYMLKDRGFMRELLGRAKDLGSPVLVFTVDLPVPGARYRDVRSGFTGGTALQAALTQAWDGVTHPSWTWDLFTRGKPHTLGTVASAVQGSRRVTDFLSWISRNFDRSVTWKDLDWVRETWDGPIVVKGVLDAEDARDAVKAGAQGLVVSNHGGRQLDGVRSSISALPRIVDAVGDDLEVLMDGGVRSGLDVLKALSLGAKAVLLGRAWAYALGAGGEAQVTRMLNIIRSELAVAMILTGCRSARAAGRELLDGIDVPSVANRARS